MQTYYICHFEDEPDKIDLPDLIEAGLYAKRKFNTCTIESDGSDHRILIEKGGRRFEICYVVRDTLEAMRGAVPEASQCEVIAILLDMHLGTGQKSGARIIADLKSSGFSCKHVWMLTAYPMEAREQLLGQGLKNRVISKPANLRLIRDEIVAIFMARVEETAS